MSAPVTVAFTVFDRADLLRRALESWSQVRGIENARLEFFAEPGCEESYEVCRAADFAEHAVHVNPERLGHAKNVHRSMTVACQVSDYVIMALDDYRVSGDILELHQWHRERYAADQTVLCLRSGTDREHWGGPSAVWRTQLVGALTGWHRDKWQQIAEFWDTWATDQGWWWKLDEAAMYYGVDVLAPALSRANALDDPLPGFTPDHPPQEYREITTHRERGFDRRVEEVKRGSWRKGTV